VRGFKIREFTDQEIRDVFETREVIETYVAGRLVDDLTEADFEALEQSLRRMTEYAKRADVAGFLETDKEFHMALVRRAGNHLLTSIMDDIRSYLSLFGPKVLAHPGRFEGVLREHRAILTALRRADRKRVVQVVRDHLLTTKHYVLGKK
jgi:DNA-binding GntR family transcriptional regulator